MSSLFPRGRHVRPSALPARVAVTTALGGLLVPLTLTEAAQAGERTSSTTRVSAPPGTVAPGSLAAVTVRLESGGAYVRNGVVDLQIPEGSGWRTVARAATDSEGIGRTSVRVTKDTQVRAHYRGSSTRSAATSGTDVVDVGRARTSAGGARTSAGGAPTFAGGARTSAGGVLAEAARHRGKPYRYGATGPSAFDCSGFTRYVYAKATGKSLPHNSRAQEDMARPVSRSAARPGDLVFIKDVAGHVGIYAGGGKMWDAPRSGKTVSLRTIWTSNYTVGRV